MLLEFYNEHANNLLQPTKAFNEPLATILRKKLLPINAQTK